jgi:hypothetical protein
MPRLAEGAMTPSTPRRRLSNRAIIGFGIALCIALALVLAWFLEAI